MRIQCGERFWRNYFLLAHSRSGVAAVVENPAIEFTMKAKRGDYDDISDDTYNVLLHDVEEEAAFFLEKKRDNATAVFLRALRSTPLYPEEIAGIVGILTDASARVDYTALALPENVGFCPDFGLAHKTPQSIYDYLDEHIYGQTEAKKAAAMFVYNHTHGRRRNAVFAGPTGCGKSEIWRALSQILPQVKIIDATQLTAGGWKGDLHWRGVFESAPKEDRNRLIVVLDEADKMLEPAIGSSGQDYSLLTQNTLLKIMDGDCLYFEGDDKRESLSVDCSGVSVILLGAFETLLAHKSRQAGAGLGFGSSTVGKKDCDYGNTIISPEDLIKYGNVRREIAGRIHSITQLHPMTETEFRALLATPGMSPVDRLAREYGLRITLSESLTRDLCRQAAESRLGVRFIQSRVQEMVDNLIFQNPARTEINLDVPATEEVAFADMT